MKFYGIYKLYREIYGKFKNIGNIGNTADPYDTRTELYPINIMKY